MDRNWPSGAVVLLTGASSGLGRELLGQLLHWGAEVHILLHPRHAGVNGRKWLEGDIAGEIFCDLSDPASVEVAATKINESVPRLNTLILCAGTAVYGKTTDIPWPTVDHVMKVNYLANVILVGKLLPTLRSHPIGRIVCIGSGSALMGLTGGAPYTASKSAFYNFFESLQGECQGSSVRLLHVMPGYMKTPIHDKQPRFGNAGSVPPTGKAMNVGSVAKAIIKWGRYREGNVLLGRNPRLAYHLRYWCPGVLRALARWYGY